MVIVAQRKLYFKQDDEPPRSKHSALKFWGEIKKDAKIQKSTPLEIVSIVNRS